MAFTSLENDWRADVVGTDMLIQADGTWLPTFASDIDLPADLVVLDGDYEVAAVNLNVPNTWAVAEDVVGPPIANGEAVAPDSTPGVWIDMRGAWNTVTTDDRILQRGMWPPSNLGVASPMPIRWFGLTDGNSTTSPPTAEGYFTVNYEATMTRTTQNIQIGSLVFSGEPASVDSQSGRIHGDMFRFQHPESVTDIEKKGMMFLHLDADANLTFAIAGETYLPAGSPVSADLFRGYLQSVSVVDFDTRDRTALPTSFDYVIGASDVPEPFFGQTSDGDAYNVFHVLPVRAEVIQNLSISTGRVLDRRAAGFFWSTQLGVDQDTGEYQPFVGKMRDRSGYIGLNVTVRWVTIGGVGRDVIPRSVNDGQN